MKIAFIVGQFPLLSETFILNQITGMIDRGHEVSIFAGETDIGGKQHPEIREYALLDRTCYFPSYPQGYIKRLLKGIYLAMKAAPVRLGAVGRSLDFNAYGRSALSLRLLYVLEPLIRRPRSYDVIHCHFGGNGIRAVFLRDAGLIAGPIVTTFHGADISEALVKNGRRIYDRLLASGDLFLPISERWKSELLALGAPRERTQVHRMGVSCETRAVVHRNGNAKPRLISVCRLTEKKGIEYAIPAVSALPEGQEEIHYDIVGDGPLRNRLETLARELNVMESITFHGAKDKQEVQQLLSQADIFIQPSVTTDSGDQEGIPVSMMEAMACGLPVLSTHHSGIPELVRDGVSGLLAPERDVTALAENLRRLIAEPTLRQKMGAAAQRTVQEEYNIERLNDRLEILYRSVMENDQGRDDKRRSGNKAGASVTD